MLELLNVSDWLLLYLLAGLCALLYIIHLSKETEEGRLDLAENLGKVVIVSVIGWPYVLVVWVFSWKAWLARVVM